MCGFPLVRVNICYGIAAVHKKKPILEFYAFHRNRFLSISLHLIDMLLICYDEERPMYLYIYSKMYIILAVLYRVIHWSFWIWFTIYHVTSTYYYSKLICSCFWNYSCPVSTVRIYFFNDKNDGKMKILCFEILIFKYFKKLKRQTFFLFDNKNNILSTCSIFLYACEDKMYGHYLFHSFIARV